MNRGTLGHVAPDLEEVDVSRGTHAATGGGRPFPSLFIPAALTSILGGLSFYAFETALGAGAPDLDRLGVAVVGVARFDPELLPIIGLGVHMAMSFVYTTFFALVVWMMFAGAPRSVRWVGSAFVGSLLSLVATAVLPLASPTLTRLLTGPGLPPAIPVQGPDWLGPLWGHVLFFMVAWLGTVLLLDLDDGI